MHVQPTRRLFRSFLSHAHADKKTVDYLYDWMTEAGIPIWYDAYNLPASVKIATELPKAISECRGMMIILSTASIQSGWVEDELGEAANQRNKNKQFRIIPIIIEKCDIPSFLSNTKYIDMSIAELDFKGASEIISGLYYDTKALLLGNTREIYISRSWREEEAAYRIADYTCSLLDKAAFRLVGDTEDQQHFELERVKKIMTSCGGMIMILPHRGEGKTFKYAFQELETAMKLGLPCLIIAEPLVTLPEFLRESAIQMSIDDVAIDKPANTALRRAIRDLEDQWKQPSQTPYIFYITNLDPIYKPRNRAIKQAIQNITALECKIGDEITSGNIRETITKQISQATLVIADITNHSLNSCIEAGIAVGANRPLVLIEYGKRHSPPFMLNNYQMYSYNTDLDLLGIIHKIVFPYRRRIINSEVTSRNFF
jgi:TIR domain